MNIKKLINYLLYAIMISIIIFIIFRNGEEKIETKKIQFISLYDIKNVGSGEDIDYTDLIQKRKIRINKKRNLTFDSKGIHRYTGKVMFMNEDGELTSRSDQFMNRPSSNPQIEKIRLAYIKSSKSRNKRFNNIIENSNFKDIQSLHVTEDYEEIDEEQEQEELNAFKNKGTNINNMKNSKNNHNEDNEDNEDSSFNAQESNSLDNDGDFTLDF